MRGRSLTLKLIGAFLVVTLAGAALSALFTRWATTRAFDNLVLDQAQADFLNEVTQYFGAHGSWAGANESLHSRRGPGAGFDLRGRDRVSQQPPGQRGDGAPPYAFALLDPSRTVVVAGGPFQAGEQVPASLPGREIPVDVDGRQVGTILTMGQPVALDPRETLYLATTNQALLYAGLISLAIALILGSLLARTLVHPLAELTAATHAMAEGRLGEQVPIRSEDELGQLAAAFNKMSADLAHANELRRQMTADIAHELRSPLTVITGYVEGLRDGVLKPTQPRFDAMFAETQQLRRLVEDLRTLSLADAGELPLARQPVAAGELLAQVAAAFGPRGRQNGVTLQVAADAGAGVMLDIDPERMVQVLENLVGNALRHTPAGGTVTLSARRDGAAALLVVQDDGEGIAADVLPHIFDRFFRGDPARTGPGGESGLGLAIAKSIVEAHGGTLTAASDGLRSGATFTIRLPDTH
ncbi:MAG TPA: ATP-binding protein [Anaerolineae bacterium]